MFAEISAGVTTTINRIISLKRKPDKNYEKRINELKFNIEHTKSEMHQALENFNNVTEPKLIDFYIYKIQSEQTRYEQLLLEYKEFESNYPNRSALIP